MNKVQAFDTVATLANGENFKRLSTLVEAKADILRYEAILDDDNASERSKQVAMGKLNKVNVNYNLYVVSVADDLVRVTRHFAKKGAK